MKSAGIETNFR